MDRKKNIYRAIVVVFLIAAGYRAASAQTIVPIGKDLTQYSHTAWQIEDGLPENSISSITQTHDGYLWLGTLEGLVRFDGVRFTVYDMGNSALQSNRIVSLLEDRVGNLWIGTEGGGITCMSHGKMTTYTTGDGLFSNTVGQLCEDRYGTIWVAQSDGISLIRNGAITLQLKDHESIRKFTITLEKNDHQEESTPHPKGKEISTNENVLPIPPKDGLTGTKFGPICTDLQGTVWICSDSGLIRYDGNNFHLFTKKDGLPNTHYFALYPGKNGELWIGTALGLVRLQDGKFTTWTTKDGLSNNFVWSLCESRDGSLLVGTQGGGLCSFNGSRFTKFTSQDGLTNDIIWSVFEDREGIIWVGTNGGGLNRLKNALFTTYAKLQGLADDFVWSVCQAPNGDFWFGTYNGLTKFSNGKFQSYTIRDGLSNNFIWSVYVDHTGQLWVGTSDGLDKYVNGKFKAITLSEKSSNFTVRSIMEDREGIIWVGTTNGLFRIDRDNSKILMLTEKDGLSNLTVMSLYESKDGSLWIGTGKGLDHYKNGVITAFSVMDGLSHDIIRCLYEDSEGNLWIGTQGGGLTLYRQGNFKQITQRSGLFNNVVSQILEDNDGDLWMSCNKGIFRVPKKELLDFAERKIHTITSFSYGEDDGMKSPECNGSSQPAGWRAQDGTLWFPTIKGVVVVNPQQEGVNYLTPPVIVENVLINKKPLSEFDPSNIPPGAGDLEVQYTGLNFYAPEKVSFRYKLSGYDDTWKDVGTRRTAYYTNLSPGSYTFWVTTMGKDSMMEGPAASFTIKLLPHFYQELWFYIFCALVVISVTFGGYRFRMMQAKSREQLLIRLVKERTQNLQEEKENAENARSEAERLQRLAEEANKVKSEILHIAAHDMKSPLISIKMYAQIIGSEMGPESTAGQFSDDIYHNSQRMLDLINELLDASAIESGKMTLQKTRVNVSRLVESVAIGNRKTAERKEQTLLAETEPNCFIEADESRVRQVIDNLISNAIKFSPNGKKIWVTVSGTNEHVRAEIRDEGPGLTGEDMEKIFGKFQRLTPRPTGGEPSTGLGLSVVKHLVEIQQGRVWVESDEGKGCKFIVEFPRAQTSGVHNLKT